MKKEKAEKRFHLFDKALNASSFLLLTLERKERTASCLLWFAWSARTFLFYFMIFFFCSASFPKCDAFVYGLAVLFLLFCFIVLCHHTCWVYFFSLIFRYEYSLKSALSMSSSPYLPLLPYATVTESSLFSYIFSFPIVCAHFSHVIGSFYSFLSDWITLVCVEQFRFCFFFSSAACDNNNKKITTTKKKRTRVFHGLHSTRAPLSHIVR